MRIEQEQTRQRWLAAFGLTPWVATRRLAGAADSELLFLFDEAPRETQGETPSNPPTAAPYTAARDEVRATATPAIAEQAINKSVAQPSAEAAAAAASLAPRLCIYQTEQTLLIAEQQDRSAPDLSRDEQQLLQALLQVFGREHRRYPFLCPKSPQHAQDTLAAFASGLIKQGCNRLLLCLSEASCAHLLGTQARHQRFELGGLPALTISSLDEMLSEPLLQKRKSWTSLCEAGFAR